MMDRILDQSFAPCSIPRIRVMHLITGLNFGGAEAMLEKLVAHMETDRFHTAVVSLIPLGPIGKRLLASGAAATSLDMDRGGVSPLALPRLLRLLREFQPHVLQTWLYHADLLGTVAAWLTSTPHLAWNIRCTELDFSRYRPLTKWTVRVLARLSSRPKVIIANSEAGRLAHAKLGYRPARWEVIPNGFDLAPRFRPDGEARAWLRAALAIPSDSYLVGLPARVDPMKDHGTFLAAARKLLNEGNAVRFVLIGPGAEMNNPVIRNLISHYDLDQLVCTIGERSDMERVLAALDLVVLSSAFGEGFPNVLGEAMACAVPCVATAVGDAGEIVGDTGLIVPPRDPDALAAAISQMMMLSGAQRAALGRNARERIKSNFSIARVVRRYEAIYETLAQRPSQASTIDASP
jgi:glycosyltransferase involved in cell wall biosynthesis